jgi:YidC/Oxa1 family membrane protein insertase
MIKNNLKSKVFLLALICLGAIFFLFSCKSDPKPIKIITNGGNHIVIANQDGYPKPKDYENTQILAVYPDGQQAIIPWSTLYTDWSGMETGEEVTYPDGMIMIEYIIEHPSIHELTTSIYVYVNPNYQEGVIDYSAYPIALDVRTAPGFNYTLGSEFDSNNVETKIIYSDGSSSVDRGQTEFVPTNIKYGTGDGVFYDDTSGYDLRKIILRGGNYEVEYTYTFNEQTIKTTIPVSVFGGDAPIHIKYGTSAQWFDYILVVWMASIMNYTSFGIFALGILFTTIIVRTLAWPIYANSNSMNFKMALAAPDLQKLEEKYRDRTDAMAKQQKQMEQMKIYKKHGVKFSGCFLMILQLPLFTAMWQVVRRITVSGGMYANSIHDSRAFGIDNFLASGSGSSAFSHIFMVVIMAVTYIILMLLGQKKPAYIKKTSSYHKNVSSNQAAAKPNPMGGGMGKMMIWIMTAVMIYMAFTNNNALTFYWIVGNLFSIFQTSLMRYLNAKKYRLLQVKGSLGSLYDDKNQRTVSYKQMVIDEVENEYYETIDKMNNPYSNSRLRTFLNKVVSAIYLRPRNFFRKIDLKNKQKNLEDFKAKNSLIGGN